MESNYDTIEVYNPLDESFSCRFNGQLYSVDSKSSKHFPQFLALHIAKHLSDKMLEGELIKVQNKKDAPPFNPLVSQLMIYDNVRRRQTLYDILRSKDQVQRCIESKPFKGFIGEMSEYDEYVAIRLKAEKKEDKIATKEA